MNRLLSLVLPILLLCPAAVRSDTTNDAAVAGVDPRLKTFAGLKRRQTEEMAAQLFIEVPPEVRDFFPSAEAGDEMAVSNSYARIQRLTGQPELSLASPGYANALSAPIHEVRDAYADFHEWDGAMLQKFADGILQSIPDGSIYFGGTDPGRFIITAVRDTAKSPDIFILTQNGFADNRYMGYARLLYWRKLSIPTEADQQTAYQQYIDELKTRTPSPEEGVTTDERGRVNVRGFGGVMAINGILAKWVFDHNKDKHGFYVEESYPIPWMYPYMEPHGLILKLNNEPMKELDPAIVARDREFWGALTRELLADPRFTGNDPARKTFSKLRSAIGGLYAYRHLATEAEAVFKQAQELCPASPEASYRLAQLYTELGRTDDAIAVFKSFLQRVPSDRHIQDAIDQLEKTKNARGELERLDQARARDPRNVKLVLELAKAYLQAGIRGKVLPLCDAYLAQPDLGSTDQMEIALFYNSLDETGRSLGILQKIVFQYPKDGQAHYEIARIYAGRGMSGEALDEIEAAIQLAPDFKDLARNDPPFAGLHNNPRFQKLTAP